MDPADSYYLWLMPEKETYDEFQQIIRDLSDKYGTPVFEPHVSLESASNTDEDGLIKSIDDFARGKAKFSVTMKDIEYTHGYFTALFVNIPNTPEIDALNAAARKHLKLAEPGPTYHPHLSLLYGEITPDEKKHIIANLNSAPRTILLDQLKLIAGHSDVTRWRVIGEWRLGDEISFTS